MSEEFQKILEIIVDKHQRKERLDKYLSHQIENITRTKIHELISNDSVFVNGKPVKPSHLISPEELIKIVLPKSRKSSDNEPEDIPLDIVYEDEYLIIVNKPAGMVTHPAYGNFSGTLVNALLHHTNILSKSNENERPGIVHRIDKGTSGLLVIAKNDIVHHNLALQFFNHTTEREYHALVWGTFSNKNKLNTIGTIETYLNRSKRDRKKIAVSDSGKLAITHYEVISEFANFSYIKLQLMTGRTHQIRVHLSHINHPVLGDPEYGGRRIVYGDPTASYKSFIQNLMDLTPFQLLHAKTLGFIHPVTNQKMIFDSKIPPNFQEILNRVKKYSSNL